ncbi:hypothetical protein BZA05DRAFT_20256 [Tricharina praecox]|uniref:uncharacterized protein n=1 Tax=Tricharina praecox TaxID=43433 RepID=UPI00221ED01D|nr:uncharacterized protein BZA05DRAFT_20256 [Tricharina praecox]KAI5859043.1 hypothetical protein BZA05DRAFT_20256 [Tricharina praecox]
MRSPTEAPFVCLRPPPPPSLPSFPFLVCLPPTCDPPPSLPLRSLVSLPFPFLLFLSASASLHLLELGLDSHSTSNSYSIPILCRASLPFPSIASSPLLLDLVYVSRPVNTRASPTAYHFAPPPQLRFSAIRLFCARHFALNRPRPRPGLLLAPPSHPSPPPLFPLSLVIALLRVYTLHHHHPSPIGHPAHRPPRPSPPTHLRSVAHSIIASCPSIYYLFIVRRAVQRSLFLTRQ